MAREDEFIETFERIADLGNSLTSYHTTVKLFGMDRTDSLVVDEIFNKASLRKKFEKLMNLDKARFSREPQKIFGKSYTVMNPISYKKQIIDDVIKEYRNTDRFDCDGFTYNYSVNLPNLDFSTKLKSDQTRYYSQAIINVGLTASHIWADTHIKNNTTKIRRKADMVNEAKENLPCSKNGKNSLIPLRMLPKVDKNASYIKRIIFELLFDKPTRIRLSKNKVIKLDHTETKIRIKDPKVWKRELRKLYTHEWKEIEWMGGQWSISIEKRSSLDYNAMLSLKILLSGSDIGKRTFQASLRLNPSSKNLYNFNLYETSIKELDEGASLGKELLASLFKQNILTYFGQQRATHLEDLTKATEPYEAYNLTYLTLAAKILKRRIIKGLRAKLGIVAYTKELLEDLGLRKLNSLTELDEQKYLKDDINHFVELITSHFEYLRNKLNVDPDDTTSEKIGKALIKRNYSGPLPISRLSKPIRREYKQTKLDSIGKDYWGGVVLELLNLASGNTPLEDIFLLLKINYPNVSYGDVLFMVNLFIEEKILIEEGTSILSTIEYPFPY